MAGDQQELTTLGLPPFRPRAPWLNGDLQTLRDSLRPLCLPAGGGTPLTIPVGDGDSLLALLDPADPADSSPAASSPAAPLGLVLVLHGLAGDSERSGVRRVGHALQRAGFSVLRLNVRGAGAGRSLARGTDAASCSRDLLPVLQRARCLADGLAPGGRPLLAVGLSLGGTRLLNVLLESAGAPGAPPLLDGLVCICSPLDLSDCSRCIDRPRNRFYQHWLLRRILRQTLADPFGLSEGERQALAGRGPVGRISSIRAFDAAITAPRWGWSSVEAYYRGASPLRTLLQPGQSGTSPLPPTLVLHAEDDPWVPVAPSRRLAEAQLPGVEVLLSPGGGHNGFHAVDDEPLACWSDRLSVRWLRRLVGASP
jgi:predicted alpha/beta-fold hydrolase